MNQLETRTQPTGEEASTTDFLLSESVSLAEAIAGSLNDEIVGARIEVGPADVQIDTADMTPKSGVHGVITSLKGGLVSRIALMVDNEVQELLQEAQAEKAAESGAETDSEARSAWLATVAEPMEQWARLHHTTMDSALPIDSSRQVDHLLLGQGLVIVAVGLFVSGRHVGSLALAGFERNKDNSVAGANGASSAAKPANTQPGDGVDYDEFDIDSADSAGMAAPVETPLVAALHRLADVEMLVTAELGRTRMNVSELLTLGPGSVIELDRAAGSPVDLLVNNTLIARGEVVVVDEEYGVRLTEIFGPAEY